MGVHNWTWKWGSYFLVVVLIQFGFCQKQTDPLSEKAPAPSIEPLEMEPIFITISPLHRTIKHGSVIIEKEIQLNWNSASNETFDSVALYTVDPSVYNDAKPEVMVKIADYPDGFYQTNVSITNAIFPAGWENTSEVSTPEAGEHCMPFWAGTLANDVLQFLTCLKIRPTWMHDHRDALGHLSLLSLLVPGTHNSACYKKTDLSNVADIITENTVTQDVDVWGQLVYGIRYISIQTSYYASKKRQRVPIDEMNFFINNDLFRIRPLLPVLGDIRKFLEISQHEVVFLDFHRFPVGMKSVSHHKMLIDLLEKEFGDIAYPRPDYFLKVPTLDMMWKENKRLVIFYGEESRLTKGSPILWEPLQHFNGRKQTVTGLFHYIEGIMARSDEISLTKGLWNIMAHLTPDPLAFFSHPEQISLRSISENSNRNISDWFVKYWWKNTSIISTDFFLNTNVINMAVNANIYKGLTMDKDIPAIQYNAPDKGTALEEVPSNKIY